MHPVQGREIILGIVIVYMVLTTLIGVWSVKYSKDTGSFMSAKNQLGTYIIGILLVSEFAGAATFVGGAQAAFERGISATWIIITVALGFFLYSFCLAGKYNATKEYTISGVITQKHGNSARLVTSVIMIYAMLTINVVSYTGGAVVLATIFDIRITSAVWVVAAITTLCVAAGGLRGVGFANLMHFVVKYAVLVITAWVGWNMLKVHPGAWEALPQKHFSMTGVGIPQIIAWSTANIGAVFATQYVIQSISSLKDPREARKASFIASLWILPIAFLAAYIGMAARALFPTMQSVRAMPEFLRYMNPWLSGIVTAGLLATSLISNQACLLGATALVTKDFYIPLAKPDEKRQIVAVRIVTVILGFLPVTFALYIPGLIKTIFFARALRASLAVVVLLMFYAPRLGGKNVAATGLVLTVVCTTVWYALNNPFGIDNIYVAVAVPFFWMLGSRLFRRAAPRVTDDVLVNR